jgi:hypothetical protein
MTNRFYSDARCQPGIPSPAVLAVLDWLFRFDPNDIEGGDFVVPGPRDVIDGNAKEAHLFRPNRLLDELVAHNVRTSRGHAYHRRLQAGDQVALGVMKTDFHHGAGDAAVSGIGYQAIQVECLASGDGALLHSAEMQVGRQSLHDTRPGGKLRVPRPGRLKLQYECQ